MTFQVGDVVVCVADDDCPVHASEPDPAPEMVGKHFRVRSIEAPGVDGCVGALTFTSDPVGDEGWCQGCFRKIESPDTKLARAMLACRPAHSPAPAA